MKGIDEHRQNIQHSKERKLQTHPIEKLQQRGVLPEHKIQFNFTIDSDRLINIQELQKYIQKKDEFDFKYEVRTDKIEKGDTRYYLIGISNEFKFISLTENRYYEIIGWLFSKCSNSYCNLMTIGLIV